MVSLQDLDLVQSTLAELHLRHNKDPLTMIPTFTETSQWNVIPRPEMDFDSWMAGFKFTFDKNAYRGVRVAATCPAKPRISRTAFKKQLLRTPPEAVALRRKSTQTTSPELSPSSSTDSSSASSSSSSSSFASNSSSLSAMITSLSLTSAAPVTINEFFEVRRSPKKGLGAFAAKDIAEGTVIIKEEPLFLATYVEVFHKYEALTAEQRAEYRTLTYWKALSENRILATFRTNRFETIGGKGGIFLKSSRFNHACHPHSTCTYIYDEAQNCLIVTALQLIKEGQELTISYCGTPWLLYENYGFWCDCAACPPPEIAKKQAAQLKGWT